MVRMLKARHTRDDLTEVGIDEAGRGCLWGPLVAAAVQWPEEDTWTEEIRDISAGIKDSKKLSAKRRALMETAIKKYAVQWSIGRVEAAEIDAKGMTRANRLAFQRALDGLEKAPGRVLIDGILPLNTGILEICEAHGADNTSSSNDVARLSGVISGSANADLLKTGAGVLELTNTNTYSGNTLIQQGTLIATNGAAIANTSAVVISNTAGATFQLNSSETIGALSGGGTTGGNVNIQGNTLTVGDQRDSTFGGIISGSGGSLSKQGTGILSLTNTSTYSGSTSVTAGSLFLNGSLTNTSSTSVSANATLAANGTIANSVSIASSGKMAIGADDVVSTLGSVTVGSMALSGSLEFGATGALTYDKLISTGALAVTSGTIAFKTSGYTVAFNTDFDIVDFGSFTGTPTFDFSGASVQQYGAWDTSAFASTGVISYVPEPSTSLLLGAFGSLALLRRRR